MKHCLLNRWCLRSAMWTAFWGVFLFGLAACQESEPAEIIVLPIYLEELPAEAQENLDKLVAAELPVRDVPQLAARYRGVTDVNRLTTNELPVLNEIRTFWYTEQDNDNKVQLDAELVYQSDLLNLWVDTGASVRQRHITAAAHTLEEKVIPNNRRIFGDEWRPGIDRDDRLNILHIGDMGAGAVGVFSSSDEFPSSVNPFSNELEMFYINLRFVRMGDDDYFEVVAHEMQHMIHWHQDRNETLWINEGLAEMAAYLNGYGHSGFANGFQQNPDDSLTYFDYGSEDYGAAYHYLLYLYDRFGEEFLQQLVSTPQDGTAGINAVLESYEGDPTFETTFSDWLVTNYVVSHELEATGVYQQPSWPEVDGFNAWRVQIGGERVHSSVNQYGADYWRVRGQRPVTAVFTGTRQIQLMQTLPNSGKYMWTTIPADVSNQHMTREIDLTGVPTATLSFWTWYDIELGWDYAYVSVSEDDGASWQTLQTIATNGADPNGNNLGKGYTGTSGGLAIPEWKQQTADLTPFVDSGSILLRFEYVTDDAVHAQGFAVDDIAIPEIGYLDDAEAADDEWQLVGFVRHTNVLPQIFDIQMLLIDDDQAFTVESITLDQAAGRWEIPLSETVSEAILIVSARTPITFQPAGYQLEVNSR